MANKYDHEGRLSRLENRVEQLQGIIKAAGLLDDFIPLSQAAKQLNCNPWVIRQRIKSGDKAIKLGTHYQMNGNRYLINVEKWQQLIVSDVKAKHQ